MKIEGAIFMYKLVLLRHGGSTWNKENLLYVVRPKWTNFSKLSLRIHGVHPGL